MTYDAIKTLFNSIIDDTVETDFTYNLMNIAKRKIELERNWVWLMAEDSSKTRSSGDIFTTMKTLPSDFGRPVNLFVGTIGPYIPIPFANRRAYQYQSLRYYIDYKNSQYAICGVDGSSNTIYFNYIYKTTDATAANASTTSPVWPDAHEYLAYKMAELYLGGTDPDEISVRMSVKDQMIADQLHQLLIELDAEMRIHGMDNSASSPDSNIGEIVSGENLARM